MEWENTDTEEIDLAIAYRGQRRNLVRNKGDESIKER